MLRRINYTGRLKVNREDFQITIRRNAGKPPSFDALLKLDDYGLPKDAQVFIEVQKKMFYMRFNYGSVASRTLPSNTELALFPSVDGLTFRVKVISNEEPQGKLLAEGDFRAIDIEMDKVSRIPLLPGRQADLGDRIWKLSMEEGDVHLEINSKLPDWESVARSDEFKALIYPDVITQVLTHIFLIEKHFEWESTGWMSRWLRFCKDLPGMPDVPEEGDSQEEIIAWIDAAASILARRLTCLEVYQTSRSQEALR